MPFVKNNKLILKYCIIIILKLNVYLTLFQILAKKNKRLINKENISVLKK